MSDETEPNSHKYSKLAEAFDDGYARGYQDGFSARDSDARFNEALLDGALSDRFDEGYDQGWQAAMDRLKETGNR